MAEKTVAEKLLIKPGASVWVSNPERRALLGPLPDGVTAAAGPGGAATAILFAESATGLKDALAQHRSELPRTKSLWIAYPKGNKADINRDSVWPIVADYGMRPIGQVAIDDMWSALRFRPLEAGEAPFTGGKK